MKFFIMFLAVTILPLLPAHAGDPFIDYPWKIISFKQYGFHSSIPGYCPLQTMDAGNTWNSTGADLQLGGTYVQSTRVSQQTSENDKKQITIEDDLGRPNPVGTLMVTRVTRQPPPNNLYLENADIFVSRAVLQQSSGSPTGGFFCPLQVGAPVPPDKYDWRTAITHEFGHAVGFQIEAEYYDDASCVMYYGLQLGEKKHSLCEAEKNEYLQVYTP